MSEASKLAVFFLALQTSRTLQKRFRSNARKEMKLFNLSPKTIDEVIGCHKEKLWRILRIPPPAHVAAVAGDVRRYRRRKSKRT